MSERAQRWGILPSYHGWQGDLIQTTPETEQAILTAMGADDQTPPHLWGGGAEGAGGAGRSTTEVIKCADPPKRVWGWAAQLYALRSRDSWGIGDLADLRRFARWSKRQGASLILVNPLGAQAPVLPYQPSPYYASTRRFRNVVYLRVEEVEGARHVDLAPNRDAAQKLNRQRIIDYDQVYRLKSQALEKIYRIVPEPRGFKSWVRRQGTALRDFAAFNALCEAHGHAWWREWPEGIRRPDGAGIRAARRELAERIAYHEWLQFHLDRQLSRASKEIGIITDVPVGFASDGFDAWRWQDYLATGTRVGAPPDEFFRDGQDWGLPPFKPWELGQADWAPFVDAIRGAAGHAAGVRLDHVMGLFRLFWIPDGMSAMQGAYVRYPAPDLLRQLAMESRRSGAFVIGEDLGLVEPAVRKSLAEIGSLSYRLLWFEGSEPGRWPHDAVAAVGTHDLPTVAGIWTRSEPEHRLHHLREKLVNMTHLPDGTPPLEVSIAAYRALAQGRPRIVLVSMEDALAVHERPNVPGTTNEFPNWRIALPIPIEEIELADGVGRVVEEMRSAGRSHDVS